MNIPYLFNFYHLTSDRNSHYKSNHRALPVVKGGNMDKCIYNTKEDSLDIKNVNI